MVRSRLATWKPALLALAFLGICFAATELGLHLHDACFSNEHGEGGVCVRSWTTHHSLKPKAHIVATNPDSNQPIAWRTNSLGLRAPEIVVPKPAGTFRVICLGDESTLAAETEESQTFCARLHEQLSETLAAQVEVLNAGCPNYGPLLSLLQLRHQLLSLDPDLVILNFDMTDIADDYRSRRTIHSSNGHPLACPHPELERTDQLSRRPWYTRLAIAQHTQSAAASMFGRTKIGETLDIESPRGAYAWLHDDAPDWSAYIDQSMAMIDEIAALCRGTHCRFILAAVPCPWQVSADASDSVREQLGIDGHAVYDNPRPWQTLTSVAHRDDVPFADPLATFRKQPKPGELYMQNGRRLSPAGHDLYARVLSDCIAQALRGGFASKDRDQPPKPAESNPKAVRPVDWNESGGRRALPRKATGTERRSPKPPEDAP